MVGPVDLALAGALAVVAAAAVLAVRSGAVRRAAGVAEGLLAAVMAAMLLGGAFERPAEEPS